MVLRLSIVIVLWSHLALGLCVVCVGGKDFLDEDGRLSMRHRLLTRSILKDF